MTGDASRLTGLNLRIVYEDLPDLIEIEVRVLSGDWSGVARAYTGPSSLAEEARSLLAWSRRPVGEFALDAGADTGIGWVHLRWYAVDLAGHLACHVQLATSKAMDRPESARLALEFPVEPYALEQFAHQIIAIVETLAGEAVLPIAA